MAKGLSFSIVIFVAALWALSSEMVEDSLVDLIYGHMFGWRTLIYALLTASAILISISAVVILYASVFLELYIGLIQKGAALLLGGIGVFWLSRSALKPEDYEVEEATEKAGRVNRSNFIVALQLVSVEELEILLIVVPLILASHVLEATIAASMGILISVSMAALLRKRFSRFVEGRMQILKISSGLFLIALGIVLFLS
jgi:uncharacterized membrane protein